MSDTPHLKLPLLAASQAQKHVTVNEALTRIDALARPAVISSQLTSPPITPAEGDAYVVGDGASGSWAGQDRMLSYWVNGGWEFATPRIGWSVWDDSASGLSTFDGTAWVSGADAINMNGASTQSRILTTDHVIGVGSNSTTASLIPSHAQVIGVTARVIGQVTGSLSTWKLGVVGSDDRYGSGIGTALNAFAVGITGQPVTYYSDTALLLTAEGGNFAGGAVRLAVHVTEIMPPRAV